MYQKKTLVDWSAFKRRYGVKTSNGAHHRAKPFTRAAFIIRYTSKLGLTQQEAEAWWTEFDEKPVIGRDNDGYKGAKQLFIPVGKMHVKSKEKFVENAQIEGSSQMKKPADAQRAVLKDHVLQHIASHGDTFLQESSCSSAGVKRNADGLGAASASYTEKNRRRRLSWTP